MLKTKGNITLEHQHGLEEGDECEYIADIWMLKLPEKYPINNVRRQCTSRIYFET